MLFLGEKAPARPQIERPQVRRLALESGQIIPEPEGTATMMDAEIYAIRKALKMLDHSDGDTRERAREAEAALDAIGRALSARAEDKPQVSEAKSAATRKAKKII
jgi:hypothetical protein